jgi:hypothetical protein
VGGFRNTLRRENRHRAGGCYETADAADSPRPRDVRQLMIVLDAAIRNFRAAPSLM